MQMTLETVARVMRENGIEAKYDAETQTWHYRDHFNATSENPDWRMEYSGIAKLIQTAMSRYLLRAVSRPEAEALLSGTGDRLLPAPEHEKVEPTDPAIASGEEV